MTTTIEDAFFDLLLKADIDDALDVLEKAGPRGPRAGHRYTRRWRNAKGEWEYEYADEKTKNHAQMAFHFAAEHGTPTQVERAVEVLKHTVPDAWQDHVHAANVAAEKAATAHVEPAHAHVTATPSMVTPEAPAASTFKAHADGSGAEEAVTLGSGVKVFLSYVGGKVTARRVGGGPSEGMDPKSHRMKYGKDDAAIKRVTADFEKHVQALGAEWHTAHRAMYELPEAPALVVAPVETAAPMTRTEHLRAAIENEDNPRVSVMHSKAAEAMKAALVVAPIDTAKPVEGDDFETADRKRVSADNFDTMPEEIKDPSARAKKIAESREKRDAEAALEAGAERLTGEERHAALTRMGQHLHEIQDFKAGKDDTGMSSGDMQSWSRAVSAPRKARILRKYRRQLTGAFGSLYFQAGLHEKEPIPKGHTPASGEWTPRGGLVVKVDGYLGQKFGQWKSLLKQHGFQWNGLRGDDAADGMHADKAAALDVPGFVEAASKIGIHVEIPEKPERAPAAPAAVNEPEPEPEPQAPAADRPVSSDETTRAINDIRNRRARNTVALTVRDDGQYAFYAADFRKKDVPGAFWHTMSSQNGMISGLMDVNASDWSVNTYSADLAMEALDKLKRDNPTFNFYVDPKVDAAVAKARADQIEKQKPIPEVEALLADGFALKPYQNEMVRFLDENDGNAIVGDEMGLGKALSLDHNILTPTGWVRFGTLVVGDTVVDPVDGTAAPVVGVYPQGERAVWEVETKDGAVIECDEEHLWEVSTAIDRWRGNDGRVLTTGALFRAGIRTGHGKGQYRWAIPVAAPQHFVSRGDRPIDPYVLGVLIGDGNLTANTPAWCKPDVEIADEVRARLPASCSLNLRPAGSDTTSPVWSIVGGSHQADENPMMAALRSLGLSGKTSPEKFIPGAYLFAPVEERRALLAGLMDTDGDTPVGSTAVYSSSSPRLAEQVAFLARSLGCMTSTSVKKAPKYQHNGETRVGHPSYRVNVRSDFNPYRLPRKAELWEPSTLARSIVDIRRTTRTTQMQCIAVGSKARTFIVDGHVVTHNTLQSLAWVAKGGHKAVVVVPKVVRRTWIEEAHKFFPGHFDAKELRSTDLKKHGMPDLADKNLVTINYESLEKFMPALKAAGFDTIIVDECFGPETLVDTPSGPRRIDSIRPGDMVLSALGPAPVLGVFRRGGFANRIEIRYGGRTIMCSAHHPFLTGRGWIYAEDLKAGDLLVSQPEAMRLLQENLSAEADRDAEGVGQAAFLRDLLFSEVENEPAGDPCSDLHTGSRGETSAGEYWQKEPSVLGADEEEQPNAQHGNARQSLGRAQGDGLEADDPKRQRNGTDDGGEYAALRARPAVEMELRNQFGPVAARLSNQLQSRPRIGRTEAMRRGGWLLALVSERSGFQEGGEVAGVRVDDVTVHQSGSYRGNEAGHYYDLKVAGHPSFSVNGVLVHNSHRAKNPKAKTTKVIQALAKAMKHRILMSGTAVKNGKEELFTQLEMVKPGLWGSAKELQMSTHGKAWSKMREHYLARSKKNVLKDLPEKTTTISTLYAPGAPDVGEAREPKPPPPGATERQKAAYEKAALEWEEKKEAEIDDAGFDDEIEGEYRAGKRDRKKERGGASTIGEYSRVRGQLALAKAGATVDMVKEILDSSDSKVIVFTESVAAAKAIAEKLGDEAILHYGQQSDDKREAAKREFQDPNTTKRVFVSTRPSLAVGATLTAADKVVFNDLPWTAADVRQAEDRAHRVGQKNAVNVYWNVAEGNNFDENVTAILRRKYDLSKKINEGAQLSPEEKAWMDKPVTMAEVLARIKGAPIEPKETEVKKSARAELRDMTRALIKAAS